MVVRALLVALAASVLVAVSSGPAAAEYSPTPRNTTWSATSGTVYAIERIGNTVYIGGDFTALRSPIGSQTVSRARLAAFNASTGELLPWNPGANGTVRALHGSGDGTGLFVGGNFSSIAGVARSGLVRLDAQTGALVTGFSASSNGQVFTLERLGSVLYVAGNFTTLRGATAVRLGAVDEVTGALVPGWSGSADAQVSTIVASPQGDRIFVGGRFRNLGGQPRDYIGAVSTADGSVTSWRPPIPCTDTQNPCFVFDLAADTARTYAAVGGPGGRVVAWDAATAVRRWAAYGDGDVQAIALDGGTVYAGGHFDPQFAQQDRSGIVALSATTGGALPWAPQIYGGLGVWDILVDPSSLRVVGSFTRIGSSTARQRYAEFPVIGAVADTSAPSTPVNLRTTNVADTIVSLSWGASSDNVAVTGYRVWRDGQVLADTGVTNYSDSTLQPDTTYGYQVQAVDAAGNWSSLSEPLAVRTQPPSNALVKVGSPWRYLSNGSDQGTGWRSPGFNDNGWSLGNAQLGFGDSDEATVISPLGLTHYFRQRFSVTDPSTISSLSVRLLRDDGAVVYLNGTEVLRSNMPTGSIGYQTQASSDVSGAAESTFVTASIGAGSLVAGQNTIAVEVHNRSGSDDVSFDLELLPVSSGPADTESPSTPQDLRTTSVTATSVGLAWDAATDDVAVAGYRITRDGSVVADVAGLTWTDSGRTPGQTYTYTVTARDTSGNVSSPSDPLSVTLPAAPGALVSTGDSWRYRQATSAPPAGWASSGFDDSAWPAGPSQLGFGDGDEATQLTRGAITYYFRREVSVPDPSVFTTLSGNLLRDDGAVVYVNGVEVFRSNMPAGSIAYATLATNNISGNAENVYHAFSVPVSALVAGTNVIAVEVHQDFQYSSDISFDLRLSGN